MKKLDVAKAFAMVTTQSPKFLDVEKLLLVCINENLNDVSVSEGFTCGKGKTQYVDLVKTTQGMLSED